MSRSVAKYALWVLAIFTLIKRRRLQRSAGVAHQGALQIWEEEGGAPP